MFATSFNSQSRCAELGALAAAILTLVLFRTTPVVTLQRSTTNARAIDAALVQHGVAPGAMQAEVVTSWNALAHDLAFAEDQFLTFKGQRAMAMMHLAMHDALNAIVPIYASYAYTGGPRIAHPVAAASQAAHDVLARAVSRSEGPDREGA